MINYLAAVIGCSLPIWYKNCSSILMKFVCKRLTNFEGHPLLYHSVPYTLRMSKFLSLLLLKVVKSGQGYVIQITHITPPLSPSKAS